MYPKVKVKEQIEEADQYAYEKSSVQSLKAFEWLSLHHFSSSDESPQSVVRIPGPFIPKSPPPSFHASKEQTSKKYATVVEDNRKNVRATSAPRPRAVLSSPDNDGIIGSIKQTRKEQSSSQKTPNSCKSKQSQSKVFPRSAVAVSFSPTQGHKKEATENKYDAVGHKKEATENKYNARAKGRVTMTDSSTRTRNRKRVMPAVI